MIKIKDADGTASYHLDPYPHWVGDDATAARGEAVRAFTDREMVKHGLDTRASDRSQQLHKALELALIGVGMTVVESVVPPLDPPFDPYRVS